MCILLALYVENELGILLHVWVDHLKIVVIYFHVWLHGKSWISHPVVIIGSTWSLGVWSSDHTSLSLDIEIGNKVGIHVLVPGVIKAWCIRIEVKVLANIWILWIETPRSILKAIQECLLGGLDWNPTASLRCALWWLHSWPSTIYFHIGRNIAVNSESNSKTEW